MSFAAAMLFAFALDAAIGWPARLYARIGHPVTWIGALISAVEAKLNKGNAMHRRVAGTLCTSVTVLVAAGPALFIQLSLPSSWVGIAITAVLAWPWIAARSLYTHVAAVALPLSESDVAGARSAVAMIVGRDPATLDTPGIARAGLESLAENASDGVVAPLFWGALLGLPGLVTYKAVNTLDSMIGHRSARFEDFGKASARLDDILNLAPARLTGALFSIASSRPATAFRTMYRDARQHRSPNAGWPEAAMAGALGIRLSGPRIYGDHVADEPWLNAAAPDPTASDMQRGLALYVRAMLLCGAGLLTLWLSGV